MKILDQLSKHVEERKIEDLRRKYSDRIQKGSSIFEKLLWCAALGIGVGYSHVQDNIERPYRIVDGLLESGANELALKRLTNDPSIVDLYPDNSWDSFSRLSNLVLGDDQEKDDESLEEKLVFESDSRVRLGDQLYFSPISLGSSKLYFEDLELIYGSGNLFSFNDQKQSLDHIVTDISHIIHRSDKITFLQGGNAVIQKKVGEDFSKIADCKNKCKLELIHPTSYSILLDNDPLNRKIIGDRNQNEDLHTELIQLSGIHLEKIEFDQTTEASYSSGGLFVNNEDNMYYFTNYSGNSVSGTFSSRFLNDFDDQVAGDFNNDSIPDVVTFDNGVFRNSMSVFYGKYDGNIEYSHSFKLKGSNPISSSSDFPWVEASKFKSEVRSKLEGMKINGGELN